MTQNSGKSIYNVKKEKKVRKRKRLKNDSIRLNLKQRKMKGGNVETR